MYKCYECGSHFDEPAERKEYHDELAADGYTPWETMTCCPICGSTDYEGMNLCVICEEPHEGCDDLCENCKRQIKSFMDKGIASMLFDGRDETYERYAKNAIVEYIVEEY